MKKNLYKFLLAFIVIIGLSPQQIIGQCISSFNNPSGTVSVSPMIQTIVSGNMNPGDYAVINISTAGEYQVNTSFGTSLNITDNSNVSLASGNNPLNVSFPTAGLYRIHVCSSNFGGSRIVAISPKNRAFNFDGTDDFIDCGIAVTNALKGKDKFTVEAWVYPTQNTAGKSIIGNHQSNTQFDIQQTIDKYTFFIGFGSYAVSTASNSAVLNTWQHVAGVFDDNVIKIYLNGVLSGTTAVPSTYVLNSICSTNLWIGKSAFGGEEFQGSVDEVRIWDRAVCQGEIQKNMNGIIPTTATNLLANYHFEHGVIGGNNSTVTTLIDYSGNNYNGIVTNAALNGATSNWVASGAYPANGASPLVDVAPAYTAPSVSIAGANGVCLGASTTFTASGNVSTYNWLSGPTTATNNVSPTTTTTYSVVGTNSLGCLSNTATITLTVSSISTTSAVTNVSCNGGSNGSATVTATGGISPYTYLASNGGTVSAQSGLMAGTYNYTVTDANSCVKTQTFSITEPSAIVTTSAVTNALCNGGTGSATVTATGGTGAYTYLASNGATVSTQSGLMAGTYNYTVTDANACEQTQILSITEPSAINVSTLANSVTICSGASSTLTANATGGTGTLTYTWVSGPTSNVNTVTPTATAVYTVDVTDANNCPASSTVEVTVNTLPTISVNSGSICAGQSFTMVPSGATTYTYSNGTDVVTPAANDSYTVTGTDANGCVSATGAVSTVTVNALPVLTAVTNNTLLCVGQTATLSVSGATTYTWNTTENTASIAVSPTVQTTYTVNGTDANGCSNNTTVTQDVSACTGIATLSTDGFINVYPNPNNGLFVIELISVSKVTVMNALGQVVIAETFEAGKHTVNINHEATGVYFVKVMTNNKQQIIKVIKE